MPLELIVGPARSEEVGVIAVRFLESLQAGLRPVLVAPDRPAAGALERELCRRAGAIVGGSVLTFDRLCERILQRTGGAPPEPHEALRGLLLRRVAERAAAAGEGRRRLSGLGGALGRFADECAEAGLDAAQVTAALAAAGSEERGRGELLAAWHATLAEHGLADRGARRSEAARRAAHRLDAWDGSPLVAWGFDDLSPVQAALLEALAARTEVLVSLPYTPGQRAYDAIEPSVARLSRTADSVTELQPADHGRPQGIAALARRLFSENPGAAPEAATGVRMCEVAGARGEAEAIAAMVAALLRDGLSPDDVIVVVPSPEAVLAAQSAAFEALGVPYALHARLPLARTPFGHALIGLCRFSFGRGTREHLFAWLRSPASGLARNRVDQWEGKLRGNGRREPEAAYEMLCSLSRPVPAVETLRASDDPVGALREVLAGSARNAWGLDARVRGAGDQARQVRAWRAALGALDGLAGLTEGVSGDEVIAALEGTSLRVGDDRRGGRVRVVGLRRARTHRAPVVVLAGLEEGRGLAWGRRGGLASDAVRRALDGAGTPLVRRDDEAMARYLVIAAIASADRQLVLVRRAVGEDGAPLAPGPVWNAALEVLGEAAPPPERRGVGELTYELHEAPSERERLRALAAAAAGDGLLAQRIAGAQGAAWARRIERARHAFSRSTKLLDRRMLADAWRVRYPASELEAFTSCSARWFVERVVAPKEIDAEVTPMVRGIIAHAALSRLFRRLPAELGKDRIERADLVRVDALVRDCVREAVAAQRLPIDTIAMRAFAHALMRNIRGLLRHEADRTDRFAPRHLEVSFGGQRSEAGLGDGLRLGDFAITGRIDRIDVDPMSARAIVHDYKSGRILGASDFEREGLLQLPLYQLALRELLGYEPVGGVYRGLSAGGAARGMLRASARDDGVQGFDTRDYVDDETFEAEVERAADVARTAVRRMRAGDVQHDPLPGRCPAWCEQHVICRKARA